MPAFGGLPGGAVYKRVAGADPAANTEVTDVVPAGKFWELLAVNIPCVQGLTQTPQPILQFTDGSDAVVFESVGSTAAQAASTTCSYNWGLDVSISGQIGATTNVRSFAPIPRIVLPPGFKIKTSTLGIGANTNYGVPSYFVIEYGG